MPLTIRLLGAFLVTFFASRVLLRLLSPVSSGQSRVLLAHAVSFFGIAVVAGVLKAHFTPFLWDASLIYVIPQLLWLAYDFYVGSRR
jgi:hypothetical protein